MPVFYVPVKADFRNSYVLIKTGKDVVQRTALITSGPGLSGGKVGAGQLTSGLLDPQVTGFLTSSNRPFNSARPKAYLNWIFLDEQFKYVANGSSAEQVDGSGVLKPHAINDILAYKNGYLYVYTSNETNNIDVFFDNLQVTHVRGSLLEESHYYPFGLTMAGISSKALSFGGAENKYKFNDGTELANKEFSNGMGLDWYETPFRSYDPQIGRFLQIDGMADNYEGWTPYAFSLNNPIFFNDPSGLEPDPPEEKSTPDNPTELAPVVVSGSYKNKWNYTDWSTFVDRNKGHDQGDLAKYLRNKGVDEKGMKLFNQAWSGIGYRERLAEIEAGWRNFIKEALIEGATWAAGGFVMKVGGKIISLGYRAYKLRNATTIYRVVSKGEKVDVLLMNGFRQAPISSKIASYEGKLFWTNAKDARWYKNFAGEGNEILKMKVDRSFIFENGDDVGRQFFYVAPERLEQFNSAIKLIK